jgi:hypothetical protein
MLLLKERGCSSMVELQPSKLVAWVRFPSPAPCAPVAQGIEHLPSKQGVAGSIPARRANQDERIAVDVAQMARAPGCGPGGRGFKSRHSPQFHV